MPQGAAVLRASGAGSGQRAVFSLQLTSVWTEVGMAPPNNNRSDHTRGSWLHNVHTDYSFFLAHALVAWPVPAPEVVVGRPVATRLTARAPTSDTLTSLGRDL